ncbi:MAG: hypothetical protein ABIQ95_06670 [Bdellovibrionia bacterium]
MKKARFYFPLITPILAALIVSTVSAENVMAANLARSATSITNAIKVQTQLRAPRIQGNVDCRSQSGFKFQSLRPLKEVLGKIQSRPLSTFALGTSSSRLRNGTIREIQNKLKSSHRMITRPYGIMSLTHFNGELSATRPYHSDYCRLESLNASERLEMIQTLLQEWKTSGTHDHLEVIKSLEAMLPNTPIMTGNEISHDRLIQAIIVQCDKSGKFSSVGRITASPSGESNLHLLLSNPQKAGGAGKAFLDEWRNIAFSQGINTLFLHSLEGSSGFYRKYGFEHVFDSTLSED